MNLKEFLAEEKELRKQRKLEKKRSKKNPKTKEEKFIKIGSIIVGILITFMALFRACSGLGGSDFSWYKLIGISDEMIIALEEPIDENTLLPNGKIDANDLDTCVEKVRSIIISNKCRVDRIEELSVENQEEFMHELLIDKDFENEEIVYE